MENSDNTTPELKLDLDNLRAIKVLGKGAMGTVFLVHHKSSDPTATSSFALKVVEKSFLLHGKADANRRARWEISVLSRLKTQQSPHPFLPLLLGSLETENLLCWATPFCPGSDLNALRYRQPDHVFSPCVIRFYLAEIICALEKLHNMGIVYRDLKPENILIQQSGHVTLTDFDLSRSLPPKIVNTETFLDREMDVPPLNHHQKRQLVFTKKKNNNNNNTIKGSKKSKSARVSPVSRRNHCFLDSERSYSFVGTEEYIAPEIIRADGHEFAVDWWALGVLCYEMLYGTTPFKGKNRKETFHRILVMSPVFQGKPNALTDLIGKLLEKDPTCRLGHRRGACEIKEHEYFKGLRWDLLTEVARPPFIPSRDGTDVREEELVKGGVDIREHFLKLKVPTSPLWSPSMNEHGRSVSSMNEHGRSVSLTELF